MSMDRDVEHDAHLAYLVQWAFLMVARIVLAMLVVGLVVGVLAFAAGWGVGEAVAVAGVGQALALVVTIYVSAGPKLPSEH